MPNSTNVHEGHWYEITQEKRRGRFLFFFPTEWWETTNRALVGNEIHVQTTHQISVVYVNGERFIKEATY